MLTVNTRSFRRYPIEQVLAILHEVGIKQIELDAAHLSHKSDENYQLAREVSSGYGIKIVGLSPDKQSSNGYDFHPYEAGKEEESIKFLQNNIRAASMLGASFVCFSEGHAPAGVRVDEAWKRLVAVLRAGTALAEQEGVQLVAEFQPQMFASAVDDAPRLIDDVGSTGFAACLDFAHAYTITRGDPVSMIEALGERIGHVYLSDGTGQIGMHVPLGKGKVDFKACVEAIKKVGYEGYWSLNMDGYSFPEHALKAAKKILGTLI
ncbi:MAG: sugar phosphate isomerase/epimerase family protein [Planctomycetota bacterium]